MWNCFQFHLEEKLWWGITEVAAAGKTGKEYSKDSHLPAS